MADKLQRVGLIFKADGTVDFNKSLKEVNASIDENTSAFKLAKASWDDSTKSAQKLRDEQKYLAKQTKDYTDKVSLLEGELEDLQQQEKKNAEKIKSKKEQLTAAINTTEDYKKKCNALKSELAALEKNEAGNENAIKKKKEELAKAEKGFLDYSTKVEKLEKEIDKLNKSEANHAAELKKKQSKINQAKTTLKNYEDALERVKNELKSGSSTLKEYGKKIDDVGEKAKSAGDKLGTLSAGAAGVIAGVTATVPATEEYRRIMASLETSSELAGYSADQTAEIYKKLYSVLGDDQTAATTTANLQAMGLSQYQLKELIEGTVGAWAKYGDSIPIDGLAESINETVKAGQVTGTFADVLNWGAAEGERYGVALKANTEANEEWNKAVNDATSAEDFFNLALQECSTEAERVNLVMSALAGQGLTEAGKKWQENNEELVRSKEAQADLQEQVAELAETVQPIVTDLTEIMTELLGKFNELPEGVQIAIGVFLLMVTALAPLLSGIGTLTMGIGGVVTAFGTAAPKILGVFTGIGNGAKALFGIFAANPVIAIITAVIAIIVVLYNKCDWFRNGVNKIVTGVKDTVLNVVKKISDFFSGIKLELPKIKLPHFSLSGKLSLSPPSVPKISVDWYAKGGILNKPTIFGYDGQSYLGGGEAGEEAVLPIDVLRKYIREENQSSNSGLIEAIVTALSEALGNMEMTPKIELYLGNEKLSEELLEMIIYKLGKRQRGKLRSKGYADGY